MINFDKNTQLKAAKSVLDVLKPQTHHISLEECINKARQERENQSTNTGRVREDPRLPEHDDEMDLRQLRQEAMRSLHLLDDVIKTDEGYVVT